MDSMEWFLGSVAVLTAVLLVGLDTATPCKDIG